MNLPPTIELPKRGKVSMKLNQRILLLLAMSLVATVASGSPILSARPHGQTASPPQNSKQELNDQLWEAARKGDAAAVTALLDKGADVNAKFRYGTTALFKAAERGNTEVVKVLLARGADVAVKDTFYGATAMTWALDQQHVEVVRALLEKNASSVDDVLVTAVNKNNVSLVHIALEKGGVKAETLTAGLVAALADKEKAEIAELLKKAGAQPPLEVDAATLATYAGRYKPEQGADVVVSVKEGKLVATLGGQAFPLMALEKTVFRPVAFEGLTITFNSEAGKVANFTLKQGQNNNVFKKIE
jgi:Ankyrin repeats (3 copies)/Domain of unknown function (DUF3471)